MGSEGSFLLSLSPNDLLAVAGFFADIPGTSLLYSGGKGDAAESSLLGLFPVESIEVNDHLLTHSHRGEIAVANPWQGLQEHFFDTLEKKREALAFGWLGYGMGAWVEDEVHLPYRPSTFPDAYWQIAAIHCRLDHKREVATVTFCEEMFCLLNETNAKWAKRLSSERGWRELLAELCQGHEQEQKQGQPFSGEETKESYLCKIKEIQTLIAHGEVYQVNLSQQFKGDSNASPFALFLQLIAINPTPFSVYFCHPRGTIVSASPERFLCKQGSILETRPIKGTIRRGNDAVEDSVLKNQLLASPKERSELLMITDLMRNDLGRVSQVGSVHVKELIRCEAYTSVFHLLSIITGKALPHLRPLDIVRSCFPGGSVTGCPKWRAMEVIDKLEERPRGLYTGSIGYFTGRGDFDLNIAIRTLLFQDGIVDIQLGGGIVIDSDGEKEYEETLIKGQAIFKLLGIGVYRETMDLLQREVLQG